MNYSRLEKWFWGNRWLKKLIRIYFKIIKRDNIGLAKVMGVNIGSNCIIYDDPTNVFGTEPWLITVGNHVEICSGVEFVTHEGQIWVARELDNKFKNMDCFRPIVIKDNVFIGAHTFIMPGINIGNNVVIGAGSIVTKNISDNSVVAGSPAKKIATIEECISKLSFGGACLPTKNMSPLEKKVYIKQVHKEWFHES